MVKRILKFSLLVVSLFNFALAVFWIIRPLPVPLSNPEAQAIEDVIVMSREIESVLICDPKSDLNLLNEVYIDLNDYKFNKVNELYINTHFRNANISESYLAQMTRYILWDRSIHSSTTLPENQKHCHSCQFPHTEPKIRISSIAIRDNLAVVVYSTPSLLNEAILIKVKNMWFIAYIRNLQIIV